MPITRRSALAALATLPSVMAHTMAANREGSPMYGLIGKIRCVPGKRDALAGLLARATGAMPGCISYIVAKDAADADALWVTEVWDSPASHKASLSLPAVRAAIAEGRPMIAGFGERFETEPVGGVGLAPPAG
ncbi:putative quinol monooxygenase [Massilia terrae]|uniref:Antibiotic biosynthesis monooxygenase n=1 Tax=Massilia terrae TaxID=1811224 RepID=A0ABT2CZ19_9BURK|nr:antibiotic biosynthesis monooxygenase [Massilia terrae]